MTTHSLYDEVDELEEELNEQYEDILAEILPEAFAVVKSTCQRLVAEKAGQLPEVNKRGIWCPMMFGLMGV